MVVPHLHFHIKFCDILIEENGRLEDIVDLLLFTLTCIDNSQAWCVFI